MKYFSTRTHKKKKKKKKKKEHYIYKCNHFLLHLLQVRHSSGKRSYQRLYNKVKDARSKCTVFANEFCHYAYSDRQPGEDQTKWHFR